MFNSSMKTKYNSYLHQYPNHTLKSHLCLSLVFAKADPANLGNETTYVRMDNTLCLEYLHLSSVNPKS